jgi:8-oxo-dGTP pyrophosphatase MutT (NUDIX family)
VIDESWYVRPTSGVKDRTSAGGIIVREDGQGKVWLALTRGEGSIASYILPKGGVDPGESIEEAARREIEEEAGFSDLTLIAPLGSQERLSFDKRRWITTHYFLFSTAQTDPRPTDPHYPYVTEWFLLDDELPPLFWPEQAALVQKVKARYDR